MPWSVIVRFHTFSHTCHLRIVPMKLTFHWNCGSGHASTVPSLSSLFCASNSINSRPTTRWNGSTLSAPLQRYIQHRQMCRETRPSELPGGTSPDQDLTNVVPGAKEAAKMHAPQQVAYHLQHKTHGHHATRHTHPLDSAAAAHTTPAGATPESGETKQNEYPFDAIFEDDQVRPSAQSAAQFYTFSCGAVS